MRVRPAGQLSISLLVLAAAATAGPVELRDPTPRWIDVAFEVSPRDQPTQTDDVYTEKIPARLEPGEQPGQIVVTVDRNYVESVLFGADEPVSGSFSDFVWVFDANTGEVVSASLSGMVHQQLDWGFFSTRARTHVSAEMASDRVAGVEAPRRWLGSEVFGYCDDPNDPGCSLVPGRRYDASTGYVYAVGPLAVRVSGVAVESYSPLGEAIFSERISPEIVQSRQDSSIPDRAGPTAQAATAEAEARPTAAVSSGPLTEP